MNTEEINFIENKISDLPQLLKKVAMWRLKDQKIVFTNGCFDLLHAGHVMCLKAAAGLGNKLIVAMNSDASVKRLKGENRPIQDEKARLMVLASLHVTDAVILFDNDTPVELISAILPDVLVKGGDWRPDQIAGYHEVTANGGEVKTVPLLPGYSTSDIEKKIISTLRSA